GTPEGRPSPAALPNRGIAGARGRAPSRKSFPASSVARGPGTPGGRPATAALPNHGIAGARGRAPSRKSSTGLSVARGTGTPGGRPATAALPSDGTAGARGRAPSRRYGSSPESSVDGVPGAVFGDALLLAVPDLQQPGLGQVQ